MNKTSTVARFLWSSARTGAIAAADLIIQLSLMRNGGRPKPTTRTTWPKGLRENLWKQQGGRCMYCRTRLLSGIAHIDHMTPVKQGGSNDPDNLQLLCPGCNLRKADRNDAEFRARYRQVLPQQARVMPSRPIKRSTFQALTQGTSDVQSYTRHRAGKYLTPAQKVNSGVVATGIVVAGLIFFPLNAAFDPGDASALLLSSLGVGATAGGGVRLRAWHTGQDQED